LQGPTGTDAAAVGRRTHRTAWFGLLAVAKATCEKPSLGLNAPVFLVIAFPLTFPKAILANATGNRWAA